MIVERGSRGNRFCLKIINAGFRSFFSACLANLIIIDRKTYLIYKSKLAKAAFFSTCPISFVAPWVIPKSSFLSLRHRGYIKYLPILAERLKMQQNIGVSLKSPFKIAILIIRSPTSYSEMRKGIVRTYHACWTSRKKVVCFYKCKYMRLPENVKKTWNDFCYTNWIMLSMGYISETCYSGVCNDVLLMRFI